MDYIKSILNILSASLLFILLNTSVTGQDIRLANPSFEDTPHYGKIDEWGKSQIRNWDDCATINKFHNETPPDIHSGNTRDTAFWKNNMASAHGNTYLGLVVRDNDSWEAISQRLALPLKKEKCYSFSIHLARSDNYWSLAKSAGVEQNFIKPVVFQLWGGTGPCGTKELLAESTPIDHSHWKKYEFFIEPRSDIYFVTIQAFYITPVLFPYNGHILVDGASEFSLTPCDEEEWIAFTNQKKEKEKELEVVPAHKAKNRRTEEFVRVKKENKVDTVVYNRPEKEKILTELHRDNLKKGQSIKIDRLYFEADTTSIGVDSYEVLNEVYEFLKANPDIIVEIGGHTNGIPQHVYCDKLSTLRAEAVANYLIAKGIDEERVSYKGYGKRRPIASNSTPEGRKKNQRVEIKIISMDS